MQHKETVKLVTMHNLALMHENTCDDGSVALSINLGITWM